MINIFYVIDIGRQLNIEFVWQKGSRSVLIINLIQIIKHSLVKEKENHQFNG